MFCGPCENRTRGTTVTGWYVSHYTNGPIVEDRRFELLSPPCKGGAKPSQLIPHFEQAVGLEPTTLALEGRRSSQLSYACK